MLLSVQSAAFRPKQRSSTPQAGGYAGERIDRQTQILGAGGAGLRR
jgi:hypothetical protein